MVAFVLAAALTAEAVQADDANPLAGAGADAAAREDLAGDGVERLSSLVRSTSAWEVEGLVRSEPAFATLTHDERRRLLGSLEEPVRAWAPLLNLYPGYGTGSMAEGDRRGVWVAGIELLATAGVMVGLIEAMGDPAPDTPPAEVDRTKRTGRAVALTSLALLGVTRVVSITLPFTFRGARHAALERAFSREPDPTRLTAWLAADGPAGGVRAGAALRF